MTSSRLAGDQTGRPLCAAVARRVVQCVGVSCSWLMRWNEPARVTPVDAAEAWALATAVRARAFGRKVDVVSPEGLVVLKLRAYLSDPESRAGGKHRVDAMPLLQTVKVDIAGLRQFVADDPVLAAELERCLLAPPPRGRLG